MLPAITKLTALLLRISRPTAIFRLCVPLDPFFCVTDMTGTLLPPTPSTTLPERISITLAWHTAPNTESRIEPPSPTAVMARVKLILDLRDQSSQKGISAVAVTQMVNEPSRPACNPVKLTPPFVPGATIRQGAVIRRGCDFESMPNSEEKVSDATAA
jgi:hypothetical protein